MENKNEGTVTISLLRYNELIVFEKAVNEEKSVSIYFTRDSCGGSFSVKLLTKLEVYDCFLAKFNKMQKEIDELIEENDKLKSNKKRSWLSI